MKSPGGMNSGAEASTLADMHGRQVDVFPLEQGYLAVWPSSNRSPCEELNELIVND